MNSAFEHWQKIFAAKQFDLTQDLHFITADEIKAIAGAEPRILAKMDSSANLPPVFKQNGYFLLPVKNGKYAIVRGNGFHRLEPVTSPATHFSRIKFHLTTAGRGASEMQYLDYSFNAGALENALGIAPLYQSIRGREFSKQFQFSVQQTRLQVASTQLEVDSGLEGQDSIVLIEAKINTPEDFIVRQLFYPYNHFRLVSPEKKIVPVFFTYEPANRVYKFWIYEFADPTDYNSIRLKAAKAVMIHTAQTIELSDITPKGLVPYQRLVPQANDLNKIVEMVFKVNEGINNSRILAEYFAFDQRQSSYYREAAEALGLVASEKGVYKLTEVGKELAALPAERRNLFMVGLVCEFNLIRRSLDILMATGELSRRDVEEIIAKESSLSGSTVPRRAASLSAWLKWISQVTGAFVQEDKVFRIGLWTGKA